MNRETSSQAAPQAAGVSARVTAVWFVVFGFVAAIPVMLHPLPPLLDYPNHLARAHVIATIGADRQLSQFYQVEWQIIPNLIMDVLVPLAQPVLGIYRAGQSFTVITILLVISGALCLHRVLYRKWSLVPLLVAPLAYNRIFLVGLMNYTFGVGLAMWALAAWLYLRERAWAARLLASALFCVALFFCHLFTVALYGLGVFAVETWRLWTRRDRPLSVRIAEFVSAGLPFVPVLVLLGLSPTWGLSGENRWEMAGKLDGLYAVIGVYSVVVRFALLTIVAAAVAWALWQRALSLHPVGWIVLGVGAIVYLAMPGFMFSTYMADQRLPIALVFLIISCANLELHRRAERVTALALLACLLIARVVEVDVNWRDLSRDTLALRDSIGHIDQRGPRILVAQANETHADEVRDYGLELAPCLAVIERSALVSTLFTIVGKQVIRTRPAYRGQVETGDVDLPDIEQLETALDEGASDAQGENPPYWRLWQNKFDYVYVVYTHRGAPNPFPALLTTIYEGDQFQLYRIMKRGASGPPSQ
jgi:hypothetical protein